MRSMRNARAAAALVVAAACVLIIACQAIVGLREPTVTVDTCTHTAPPPPPAVDEDPNGAVGPLWFALRTISLYSAPDGGAPAGLDLDGTCSCTGVGAYGGGESCSPYGVDPRCDYDGGVDNGLRRLIEGQSQLAAAPGLDIESLGINERARLGSATLLVWLSGWNGKPNDKSVKVSVLVSQGLLVTGNCKGPPPEAGAAQVTPPDGGPLWDGCDRWAAANTLLLPDPVPTPGTVLDGYVSNGIVALAESSSNITISLPLLGSNVSMTSIRSSFRLLADGGDITGMFAGRMDAVTVARGLGVLQLGAGPPSICDTAFFAGFVHGLCRNMDVTRTPSSDFVGKSCDSISAGFYVTARPVLPPVRTPALPPVTGCEQLVGISVSDLCKIQ